MSNNYLKKMPGEIKRLIDLLKNYDDEIIIKSKNISDIKLNIHDQSMLYNYILDGYEDN
jgi:hypothetical protein